MTKFKVGDRVIAKKNTPYLITNNGWKGVVICVGVGWGNLISVMGEGLSGSMGAIVNPEFFDLDVTTDQKIVITTDGRTTTAKLYHGKTVNKTATAKCSPDDKFDFVEGAKIAFDRLTDRETHKPETGKIKVGDLVKVVNTGEGYPTAIGRVMTFIKDPLLIARYAYGNDLGHHKSVRMLDETFKVLAINGSIAYITENINSNYSPCYAVGISGLKKIGG